MDRSEKSSPEPDQTAEAIKRKRIIGVAIIAVAAPVTIAMAAAGSWMFQTTLVAAIIGAIVGGVSVFVRQLGDRISRRRRDTPPPPATH
jgi:flagellar basal body-associated protein FliL